MVKIKFLKIYVSKVNFTKLQKGEFFLFVVKYT